MTAEEHIAAKLDAAGFVEYIGKPVVETAHYTNLATRVSKPQTPPVILPVNVEPVELFHDDAFGMAKIMAMVSQVTGLKVAHIVSHRRNAQLVKARMIFCYVARELTSRSFPQIGQYCGKRDHSTVHHAVGSITRDRQRFEPELSVVMDKLST